MPIAPKGGASIEGYSRGIGCRGLGGSGGAAEWKGRTGRKHALLAGFRKSRAGGRKHEKPLGTRAGIFQTDRSNGEAL